MRTSRVYIVNEDENAPKGARALLNRYCCAWVAGLPTLGLVLLAMLILLLVVSVVPLSYLIVSMAPARDITSAPGGANEPLKPVDVVRKINAPWPLQPAVDDEASLGKYALATRLLAPPNVTSCDGYGFSCTIDPTIRIGKNQRCDGRPDCPDGSDEADCHSCLTAFSCPTREGSHALSCLRGDALCDGIPQCADQADERLYCGRSTCEADEYKCADVDRCIPNSFRCDGNEHCPDGDDEIGCTACNNGAKFCNATKKCIPVWEVCNGVENCPDGSDETDCDCISCSHVENALCLADTTNMCIKKKDVCDGAAQCPNGVDEVNCPGSCHDRADIIPHHPDVWCADGSHYTWKYACSGLYPQCNKACDECNPELAIQCADRTACVHRSKVCDGIMDCADGTDEKDCGNWKTDCSAEPRRCDGFKDCRDDGRDEFECAECKSPSLFCKPDRTCIPSHQRCDGVDQCSDGSDEEDCSCNECSVHPFHMYSCEQGGRCFRMEDVCTPKSRCPNASQRDKAFCATKLHPTNHYF